MLTLSDSGCAQHRPRQLLLTGLTATLVGRLISNLPPYGDSHTYICEHGQTHCIMLHPWKAAASATSPGYGYGEHPTPGN